MRHHIVITKNCKISFPDHSQTASIVAALSRKDSDFNCDGLKKAIREGNIDENLGERTAIPGWLQALRLFFSKAAAIKNDRKPEMSPEGAIKEMALLNVTTDPLFQKRLQHVYRTFSFNNDYCDWPNSYESYQYCKLSAWHLDHWDFIPLVRYLQDDVLACLAVCLKTNPREKRLDIIRKENEERWVVVE
jgi:hypothetical protein